METWAWLLIMVGLIGLLLSTIVVYKSLNAAQLSLNPFGGGTREHHQGLSLKFPWSKLQQPEISMAAEIVITSGGVLVTSWEKFMASGAYKDIPGQIYETEDAILHGKWATAIRPLRGRLEAFVEKTPQVGALMTLAEIHLAISDFLVKQKTEEAIKDKKGLSVFLANVFGGENTTSRHESSYGIIVSDPKLFDLNYGQKMQDAAEKRFEAKEFRKAVADMKETITDAEKAANFTLIATKMAEKKVFEVVDLKNSLEAMATAFARRN